jgi:HD domain
MTWQIAKVISDIIELRDPFTACHQQRVVHLANALRVAWDLGASYLNGLQVAASVPDIDKIAVPMAILHKPGKLKEQEFNIIKTHPQVGYDTLTKIQSSLAGVGDRAATPRAVGRSRVPPWSFRRGHFPGDGNLNGGQCGGSHDQPHPLPRCPQPGGGLGGDQHPQRRLLRSGRGGYLYEAIHRGQFRFK